MTVTYKTNTIGLQVPILHRVVYGEYTLTDFDFVQEQYSHEDHLVNEWLKANCKHPYYHSPGWHYQKSIQFECELDAMLFALRWA